MIRLDGPQHEAFLFDNYGCHVTMVLWDPPRLFANDIVIKDPSWLQQSATCPHSQNQQLLW